MSANVAWNSRDRSGAIALFPAQIRSAEVIVADRGVLILVLIHPAWAAGTARRSH